MISRCPAAQRSLKRRSPTQSCGGDPSPPVSWEAYILGRSAAVPDVGGRVAQRGRAVGPGAAGPRASAREEPPSNGGAAGPGTVTQNQRAILVRLFAGEAEDVIAAASGRKRSTIFNTVRRVRDQLGARNEYDLFRVCLRRGIVTLWRSTRWPIRCRRHHPERPATRPLTSAARGSAGGACRGGGGQRGFFLRHHAPRREDAAPRALQHQLHDRVRPKRGLDRLDVLAHRRHRAVRLGRDRAHGLFSSRLRRTSTCAGVSVRPTGST